MTDLEQPYRAIRATLETLRNRLVARATTEAVSFVPGAVALVLAAAAVALGPLGAPEPVRIGLLVALAVALVVPPALGTWRARRRWKLDAAVAARLEAARPALRTDVRAALELARAPSPVEPDAVALRALLVTRVAEALRSAGQVDDAVVRRRTDRVVYPGLLALATVLGLAAGGPDSLGDGLERLARGVPSPVEAVVEAPRVPLVSTFDIEIRAPAYTGLPPRRVIGATADIEALVGSLVTLRTIALLPVAEARLVFDDETGTVVPLEVVDGRLLRGAFTVQADAGFHVELGALAATPGQPPRAMRDPIDRRVRVLADEPPRIELLAPAADVETTADAIVDIQAVITDEYGLSSAQLVWHFVDDESDERTLPLNDPAGARSLQEHVPFELAPLLLQPRDELLIFIEGTDNNTMTGPGRGRSRPIHVRIAAPEDRHAEVLEGKQALFESLLARLGDTLPVGVNTWAFPDGAEEPVAEAAPGTPDELVARIDEAARVRAGWDETMSIAGALLEVMRTDPLSTEADLDLFTRTIDGVRDAERNHARAIEDAQAAVRGGMGPALYPQVARADAALVDRTERAALLLEDLVAAHQADDAVRTLQELNEIRDRLRDLLEQYRATNDPALREQIERELRRLEARMRELLEQLASQVQNLPLEHLNAEGLEPSEMAEQVGEMTSALDQIRQALEQGDIDAALNALDALESDLNAMAQQLGGALEQGGPEGLSEFDQAMAELMDEINDIESAQAEIERQTAGLEAEMNRQQQDAMREEIDAVLERARREVAAVRDQLRQAPVDALTESARETVSEVDRAVQQLENALQREDIAGALEQASGLLSRLADLDWALEQNAAFALRGSDRQRAIEAHERRVEASQPRIDAVRRDLADLLGRSQPRPDPAQQGQMEQIAEQQQAARERLDQLGQRMRELGERMPIPSPDGEPMQQAGEGMEQSGQSLQGGRPRPAQQGQLQALEGLRMMRQQLQQSMRSSRQQQQGQGGAGGGRSNERVEIPEESEGARQDFRQRVLDGMREGGLESWEEQLRYYYESLVR